MSGIVQHESSNKPGVRKTKKNSVRVDLTPMVDLGFLLISFFVITTSIAHPTALGLKLPDERDTVRPNKAPESKNV